MISRGMSMENLWELSKTWFPLTRTITTILQTWPSSSHKWSESRVQRIRLLPRQVWLHAPPNNSFRRSKRFTKLRKDRSQPEQSPKLSQKRRILSFASQRPALSSNLTINRWGMWLRALASTPIRPLISKLERRESESTNRTWVSNMLLAFGFLHLNFLNLSGKMEKLTSNWTSSEFKETRLIRMQLKFTPWCWISRALRQLLPIVWTWTQQRW